MKANQEPKYTLVKSPLRYPGGKSKAVKHILKLIPPKIDTICSPFMGGGSIELACASKGIRVFAYDKFNPLVNFWQRIIKDAPAVVNWVNKYYPIGRDTFFELQKSYFTFKNKNRMAAVFYALNRCSFNGTIFSGGTSPNHPRFTKESIKKLGQFQIDNLQIKHADFNHSIKRHKNDFLYLDPPYANNQKLYGKGGDMHEDFDHQKLAKILTKRDRWILSYNDCEIIRSLYKKFEIIIPSWKYGMGKNKRSREVLILSKDLII